MLTPPPVEHGDTVAVLAPSAQASETAVERGTEILETDFDLNPVIYPSVTADCQLSLLDRAEEIHEVFESDATAAFAVTGGEDQMRLLRHLKLNRIQSNPTRFFGISDNTHLHLALSAAGLVSYYGGQFVPGLACDPKIPEYTKRYLESALFDEYIGEIRPAEQWTDDEWCLEDQNEREWESNDGWEWEFPHDEPVSGTVWGGCYLALEHLLATNHYVPDPDSLAGFVLVVESSGLLPEPYFIKSVLRCLGERGLLEQASAVIVGRPKTRKNGERSYDERKRYQERQFDAVKMIARRYTPDLPIVSNVDFGHTDPHVPVPIGGTVQLNPIQETIIFH